MCIGKLEIGVSNRNSQPPYCDFKKKNPDYFCISLLKISHHSCKSEK